MKRALWMIGLATLVTASANAQIEDVMRRYRINEVEATTALAISRGLGLRVDYVVQVRKELGTQMWNLGPVLYISERHDVDPRSVWREHRRGTSWAELDYSRGYSYTNRPQWNEHGYRAPQRPRWDGEGWTRNRYDNSFVGNRDGLIDVLIDIFGRRDYDDDYYRENRSRYGRNSDRDYETHVWDQILRRSYGSSASRLWRYLDRGARIGDVVMALHMGRVARQQPERVMDEYLRRRNWNRTREHFNVARDWESMERRRYSNRGRDGYNIFR